MARPGTQLADGPNALGQGTVRCRNNYSVAVERSLMDCLRLILSIIIPPLGVFFKVGLGLQFWINILLTLLGYFPGLIHAIWVIARK